VGQAEEEGLGIDDEGTSFEAEADDDDDDDGEPPRRLCEGATFGDAPPSPL
jgi:hypothetical protein